VLLSERTSPAAAAWRQSRYDNWDAVNSSKRVGRLLACYRHGAQQRVLRQRRRTRSLGAAARPFHSGWKWWWARSVLAQRARGGLSAISLPASSTPLDDLSPPTQTTTPPPPTRPPRRSIAAAHAARKAHLAIRSSAPLHHSLRTPTPAHAHTHAHAARVGTSHTPTSSSHVYTSTRRT
jgi:hypothetical protein